MSRVVPPSEVTVRHAEYFVAVATSGSMTAAAERLNVTQAAVSFAVSQLEKRLGARLFHRRRGQPLQLTADGRRALIPAQELLRAAQALQQSTEDPEDPHGAILVGWYATLSPLLLPPVLDELRTSYPGLELTTTEEFGDALWIGLDTGTLDLVLAYELMVPERFETEHVCDVRPRVLLPPNHELAAQSAVSLADLAAEPAVLFDVPHSHLYHAELLSAAGAEPRVSRTSKNLETVRSLVARGEGYTIAVTPLVEARSSEGLPIVVRPIRGPIPTTSLVVAHGARRGPRADAFLDACRTVAAQAFSP